MLRDQEYVGLLIAAAQRSVKLAVQRRARALGLTSQQFWFVNAARELPGASERIAPLAASVRTAVVRGMSPREQQALCAALRRVVANVETFVAKAEVEGGRPHDGGHA